jgi:DNA-binding MarR family transcriptional regulator
MTAKGLRTGRAHALSVIALGRAVEISVNTTGLTASQFRALSLVDAGVTSGAVLARFLAVRPPTVTTVMNGLVDDGLVARARATDDRRRVDYELTADGRAALDAANDVAERALSSLVADLPTEDQDSAFAGLVLWRDALDAKRRDR